jgi:hypothetical protein
MAAALGLSIAGTSLGGCITGERGRLVPDDTVPMIDGSAISVVMNDLLAPIDESPFTVTYSITTKFGGQQTVGTLVYDASLGTSVKIAEVRYVRGADGSVATCSDVTDVCEPGILEARVSDRMITSSFYRDSTVERLRTDSGFALGEPTGSTKEQFGYQQNCVSVPVVDSSGNPRDKSYCSFGDLGVIAYMDTADIRIEATAVELTADPSAFRTGTI